MNEKENINQVPESVERSGWLGRQQTLATILGVVLLVVIGVGVWYWQKNRTSPTPGGYGYYTYGDQNSVAPTPESPTLEEGSYYSPLVIEGYDPSKPAKPNTTVTWKTPAKLTDQKLVKVLQDVGDEKVIYYYLGDHGANKIIVAQAPAVDMGGPAMFFFEQTAKGFIFMNLISSQDIYRSKDSYGNFALSPSIISSDNKTVYAGLVGPNKLSWSGLNLELPYVSQGSMFNEYVKTAKLTEGKDYKKLGTVKEGDVYLFQTENNDPSIGSEKFYLRRYTLKLPSGTFNSYFVKYDFFSDDLIPKITWSDGTKNTDSFRPDGGGGGCGNPGAYIVSTRDISSELKVAGTTSGGVSVFEFKDVKNPILKYYYDLQGGQVWDNETSSMKSISIQEWYKHHAVVAYKNGVGDYVLMTNNVYGSQAECGKPVIYLYPTQSTNVSVKVGAKVTVSEPAYNKGWNVTAQPTGALLNRDGASYESLFWEGLGIGNYPQITEGTVVAREKVESTITDQLKALGLNTKESQDFKDFWMSRMPATPYVRLTWFTTSQMDQLAPLYVSPKPDTVIRVFLDFQGMQEFKSIPAQKLTTIPRQGFTLVEWGGLLKK